MKEKFGRSTIVIIIIVVALVAAGCQSGRADSVNLLLQSDSPTLVSFPLMAASQIYDFSADVQNPIQISLVPITRDLAYTAELRDEHGSVMATVTSSVIQNAVLTVEPGSQHYQVAIKSDNTTLQGMLSVQVTRTDAASSAAAIKAASIQSPQAPIVVPYQPIALTIPNVNAPCSASSSSGVSVNLRSGPGTNFGIVGTLVYGTALSVSGQSNNGWYQVIDNGQLAWVSGSVAALGGNCDNLADVTPANLTSGMAQLAIADTGWGSVYENITATDANPSKLIMITAPNSSEQYQEFTLSLVCSGTGTEALRWGAAEKPTLKCGGSVVMPLTANYRQQVIAVTLSQMMANSNVQYTLMASRRI